MGKYTSKSSIPYLKVRVLLGFDLAGSDDSRLSGFGRNNNKRQVLVARRISETVHLRVNFVVGDRSKRVCLCCIFILDPSFFFFWFFFLPFCPSWSSLIWGLHEEELLNLTCCRVPVWILFEGFVTFHTLEITCNIQRNCYLDCLRRGIPPFEITILEINSCDITYWFLSFVRIFGLIVNLTKTG